MFYSVTEGFLKNPLKCWISEWDIAKILGCENDSLLKKKKFSLEKTQRVRWISSDKGKSKPASQRYKKYQLLPYVAKETV